MAGMKGRSGGQNRKPAAMHVLAGTFRRDRHGAANAPTVNAKQRKTDALREYDHVAAIVAELHRMVVNPEDRGVRRLAAFLKSIASKSGS